MKPTNLLFILSDEHSRRVLGCYGHPMIRTPNLDRLAAGGVRFSDAYCNSPICVPSRAALRPGATPTRSASGTTRSPMTAACRSWHHRLKAAGPRGHRRSANCISAAPTTTTALPKRSCRCMSSTGSATRSAGCATRCRCGRRRCGSPTMPGAAIRATRITTTRSPRRRSIG